MKTTKILSGIFTASALMLFGNANAQGGLSFENTLFDWEGNMNHYSIETTGEGYITAGTLFRNDGNNDIEVTMLDPLGNQLWSRIIDVSEDDRALDLVVDEEQNIVVTGYISPDGYGQMYAVKFDAGGNLINDFLLYGFEASAGTNIIYSENTGNYILGGFIANEFNIPITGSYARILELDGSLNPINYRDFSTDYEEHAAINDIVETSDGYFITGSTAITASTPAGEQGVMALFIDYGLNVYADLSFESTSSEHVGVSAVYDNRMDEVILMSNNSDVHNPQITEIENVSSFPSISTSYYLELDPSYGEMNAAGFKLEPSFSSSENFVASGYFKTADNGDGAGNHTLAWIVEFERNTGNRVGGFMWLTIANEFHAEGDGVFSTFINERPYIFNQEMMTTRWDGEGYALIAPHLLEEYGGVFGIDVIAIGDLATDYIPCFEQIEYEPFEIEHDRSEMFETELDLEFDFPYFDVPDYYLGEEIYCDELNGFDRATAAIENLTSTEANISIVPNPVTSSFFMEISGVDLENAQITIQNTVGQVIYTSPQLSGENYTERIDMSKFSEGVYLLRLVNNGEQQISKIIKL